MNYQELLDKVLEGTKAVLVGICTITYAVSSVILFVSVYALDKLNKVKDVNYTVDLEIFGHKYTLKLTT